MNQESEHIQALRDRYKSSFSEKAQVIGQHLQSLLDDSAPPESVMNEVRGDLHKLAGSLGMYDYTELAEIARAAMSSIDNDNLSELEQELLNLRNLLSQQANS